MAREMRAEMGGARGRGRRGGGGKSITKFQNVISSFV